MSRRRAIRRPIHRAFLVCGLTFIAAGASFAWQAPAPVPGGAGGAALTAANVPGQTLQVQPEPPCPPVGLAKVLVTRVSPITPLKETTGTGTTSGQPARRAARPDGASGQPQNGRPTVELRDTIAVTVEGLETLIAQERCLEKNGSERSIILYLDHRPLPDVVANPPSDPTQKILMFPMIRTEASREVWTYLLGRPRMKDRVVEVSVGIDNQFSVPSVASVNLRVIPRGWFYFWLLIFGLFVIGFVLLSRRSDLLRDPVPAPPGARPPYSLSRVQAAWWFFLIFASYLLIGMITGDFATSITGTVLVLLGISAGTAAGSAFIDASKTTLTTQAQDAARAAALQANLQAVEQKVASLTGEVRTSGDPVKANELAVRASEHTDKLSKLRKLTNQSEGFLLDILSDTNGVNFHRFQMMAWTVVLGIIFGSQVYRDLAMPQFSETLLALMGISAGTYLGLKIPENQSPAAAPAVVEDPPA
jgi:hypothetical protein